MKNLHANSAKVTFLGEGTQLILDSFKLSCSTMTATSRLCIQS